MNPYRQALAFWDALALEGVSVERVDGELELVGAPSAALEAKITALFATPELGAEREAVQAQLDRATALDAGLENDPVVAQIGPKDVTELLARARHASPAYRALSALTGAVSQAAREVLTLDVAHLVGLPVPFTVTFMRRESRCMCTTAREVYERCVAERVPVFLVRELVLAARAVAQGRVDPSALDRWVAAKRRGPWHLTADRAGVLEGVLEQVALGRALCVGELFDDLGAELVDVVLHEAVRERGAA